MKYEKVNNPEKQPIKPMLIAESIDRYYEAHNTNLRYEIVRSELVEGHEVAWMKYTDHIKRDMVSAESEEEHFEGYCLQCACHFTEGVGWFYDSKYGGPVGTDADRNCEAKKEVQNMRNEELKEEYTERQMLDSLAEDETQTVKNIMLDLIEKNKKGEFLESYSGASFWGGHYYLQLVESITGLGMAELYDIARQLEAEKIITLNGAVVCTYREPLPPKWEYYGQIESEGWKVRVSMPTHEKMAQTWKFEVANPEGDIVDLGLPELQMMYSPIFGPDAGDVVRAQEAAQKILAQLISENKT